MKRRSECNQTPRIIHVGIAEALAEITRQAEMRLRNVMKPARLAPLNLSHRNGMAASNQVIEQIRREESYPQSACV